MDASEHRRLVEGKAAQRAAEERDQKRSTPDAGPNYWNKTMNEAIEKGLKGSSSYEVNVVTESLSSGYERPLDEKRGTNAGVYEAYITEAPAVADEWRAKGYNVSIEEKTERETHGGWRPGNSGSDNRSYTYHHSIVFKLSSRKKG